MRIAVDISMLEVPGSGIARYIKCILPVMIEKSEGRHHWLLYGRQAPLNDYAKLPNVTCRADHLPRDAGRIMSLFISQPIWSTFDRPDVYWSPAHRLPWILPDRTASIVTVHDLCWLKQPETMRFVTYHLDRLLMPRSLERAKQVIAISKATAEDIRHYFEGPIEQKISITPEGGSHLPSSLPFDKLKIIGIKTPYVLFVGSFEPRKNLSRLLKAFKLMVENGVTNTSLVIVGAASWGRISVKDDIATLGLADRVCVLEHVDDEVLATLYQHALCLAAPSLLEGFCLPVVEAMTFGTPVLASLSSAFPEVVGPGGLLVDPLLVESIADGLTRLVVDTVFRQELGRRALEHASSFSWDRAGLATLEVLERSLESAPT